MSDDDVPRVPQLLPVVAQAVDPATVAASYEHLSDIFEEMMATVHRVSQYRCPYKDRQGLCTAVFGCRNQRRPAAAGGPLVCGGDDKLDYRSAWEAL